MIDETTEKLITLDEATREIPPARSGKRTHVSTLCRWILKGVRGPDGGKIYLEAVRKPSGWLTTREALRRFLSRLTPPGRRVLAEIAGEEVASVPQGPGHRRRAAERAGRELERMGI